MTENTDKIANLDYDESIWFPWIVLSNNYKVAITCPGCGTTHHGLWSVAVSDKARGIGSFTQNLQQPLCCMKTRGRRLTIGHRNGSNWVWRMIDNKTIDSTTYEGFVMDSFIRKNQLQPTFVDEGEHIDPQEWRPLKLEWNVAHFFPISPISFLCIMTNIPG